MLQHSSHLAKVVGEWLKERYPTEEQKAEAEQAVTVPLLTILSNGPGEEPGTIVVEIDTRVGAALLHELDRSGQFEPIFDHRIVVYQNAERTRELIIQADDGEESFSKRIVIPQLVT